MKYVCKENQCTGCMACVEACSQNAIKINDGIIAFNAVIDPEKCINCRVCERVCQNNSESEFISPIAWYQGWAEHPEDRAASSSGGFGSMLAKRMIELNGVVCSCVFRNGEFRFEFIDRVEDLSFIKGSKYVKSNPERIYGQIKDYLNRGQKVLFLGLPCQVAAVKKYIGKKYDNLLYTVDLICHGTPSSKLLDTYLREKKIDIRKLKSIAFREKTVFRLYAENRMIVPKRTIDWYSYAFLQSLDYTENCYTCKFARTERVSDITIGDSWKSSVGKDEMQKGVSLALCQTEKGMKLLNESDVTILKVDLEKAIKSNHQLMHPSIAPVQRGTFFNELIKKKSFHRAVFRAYPKLYFRNQVKVILANIIPSWGDNNSGGE